MEILKKLIKFLKKSKKRWIFLEEEILTIDKDGKIKALGLVVEAKKIKIEINGIDLTKNIKMETLRIVKEE